MLDTPNRPRSNLEPFRGQGLPTHFAHAVAAVSLAAFRQRDLEQFTRTFEALFYADDPVSMSSYYTDQAQLMADGITPIQGQDAIARVPGGADESAVLDIARARGIRLYGMSPTGGAKGSTRPSSYSDSETSPSEPSEKASRESATIFGTHDHRQLITTGRAPNAELGSTS